MKLTIITTALLLSAPAGAQGPSGFIAVDGDTIRSPAGVRYRLLGFDAPETFQARCDEELALGLKAKERLQELISSGVAVLLESGETDKYGRTLARLTVSNRDVGAILIAEGLARPYSGGKREGWCK